MKINTDAILVKLAEQMMSRQALAEKSGIAYRTLCGAMSRGQMTTETLGKVAHALGCKVEEIIQI